MLDAEFINRIADLAQQAAIVQVVEIDDVHDRVLVKPGDGPGEWVYLPPPREQPCVLAFDDFVAKAIAMGAEKGEIYFNQDRLTGLADAKDRRDCVMMSLRRTDQVLTLERLSTAPMRFDHPRDAVRFLRFDLPGAVPEATRRALSKVSFKRASSSEAAAWHGQEHLGRSVSAEAAGEDAIPERFTANFRIWKNPGFEEEIHVEIGIYLDVEKEKVEVRLLADSFDESMMTAVEAVGARLREKVSIPVYHGSP